MLGHLTDLESKGRHHHALLLRLKFIVATFQYQRKVVLGKYASIQLTNARQGIDCQWEKIGAADGEAEIGDCFSRAKGQVRSQTVNGAGEPSIPKRNCASTGARQHSFQ
ncbi:MAG: hypothetical protein AAF998_01910 [Bacteroidota bacterium]